MTEELGEPRRLTFVPQEHQDVVIVYVRGGRIGRAAVRTVAPVAGALLWVWFAGRRLARRVRDRAS
jgi:hypothetical protein